MGILDRLRALLGGDGDVARGPGAATLDDGSGAERSTGDGDAVAEEQAIEAVEAGIDAARADALFAMTDTPGSVDG